MFRLSAVILQLQTNLAHALCTFARLDLVGLLALCRVLGTHLLMQFLLATLALELDALDDVDGPAPWDVGRSADAGVLIVVIIAPMRKSVQRNGAIPRKGGRVRRLRSPSQTMTSGSKWGRPIRR